MVYPEQMRRAKAAVEKGNKAQARAVLRRLILQNPRYEQTWFLLAQVVEERYQVVDCLERVLLLNPNNHSAFRALSFLQPEKIPSSVSYQIAKRVLTESAAESVTATVQDREPSRTPPGQPLETYPTDLDLGSYLQRSPLNWSLIVGGILVLAIFLLAIMGPNLAPRDPLETTVILQVDEGYLRPPYPLFSPGFPLGSDGEGRDLLSRLLWGIRPTMILVLIVALVRLVVGTLIGLIAGWSTRWPGRMSDTAIAAAISIPVIIVALGGIAAVGVDLGIWAFIIALTLTGWVETARVVREQTHIIREQIYIEAAHALGGSNVSILSRHVLHHMLSLLWMLFAFEISSTLMLVAGLGFLGYYIGGDIWVQVTDATAAAISGMPEMGQMLATVETSVTQPWALIIIGACIFVIILGFNLLGEGLRKRTSLYGVRWGSRLADWLARLNLWADQNLLWPLSNLTRKKEVRIAGLVLILLTISGSLLIWQIQGALREKDRQLTSAFPQYEGWVSSRHDPHGTRWSQAIGLSTPHVYWTFSDGTGFPGGPVVSGDGTVYIASKGSVLYAIDPSGGVIWETLLPETPIGSPVIGEDSIIFISDQVGGLSAVNPNGEIEWYYQPEMVAPATTGPVVSPNGTVFYIQGREIQAVSENGKSLWLVKPPGDTSPTEPLQLSPDGGLLFWGGVMLDTKDGSTIAWEEFPLADRYIVGADGKTYLIKEHEIFQWQLEPVGERVIDSTTWDYEKYTLARTSKDAGVTPDGLIWLLYTGFARGWGYGEDTRLIWLDRHGGLQGNAFYPTRNSQVIAIDQKATIYSCGNLDFGYGVPECQAFSPELEDPIWKLRLEDSTLVAGGALVPGRLYIATQDGTLYALGEAELPEPGEEIIFPDQEGPVTLGKEAILEIVGEPVGPRSPVSSEFTSVQGGFSGGPAMGQDSMLYLTSNDGSLYALNPDGKILWQVDLPAVGVGSPGIGKKGEVYVVDQDGGVSSFSREGEPIWYFQQEPGLQGISGPLILSDGIYYTVATTSRGSIQALSPEGESLWLTQVETDLYFRSPEASTGENLLFFRDEIFTAKEGKPVDLNLPFDVDRFFRGQDGKDYLLAEGTVAAWEMTASGAEVSEDKALSPRGTPRYVGVTPEGIVWLLYSEEAYWFTSDGQALGVSNVSGGWIDLFVAIDQDLTIYICGRDDPRMMEARLTCFALSPLSEGPVWVSSLASTWEQLNSGVLTPGRIYVLTKSGQLYFIEESQ
jgi:peptide/nickel transport system permease protein